MKKLLMAVFMCVAVIGCAGGMGDGCCGWSSKDITGSGQVKRVSTETPIFCPDYHEVDISLGVMRNGVGSMSTHDMIFYIESKDVEALRLAAEAGAIIDFTYDTRRINWCVGLDRLTSFKVQNLK